VWQVVKKYEKRWLIILLLIAIATVVFVSRDHEQESSFSTIADVSPDEEVIVSKEKKEEPIQTTSIFVDVKGAVVHQGVYEVNETARVKDVIVMAGGFTKEADQTKVNLAAKVHDEMVIYVPMRGETNVPLLSSAGSSLEEKQKIDINTASLEEIEQLQGIGPTKAAAIIAYREEHGPFRKIEDLLNVAGIGEKSLEKMKEQIIIR
jgi:competence protein ComEA